MRDMPEQSYWNHNGRHEEASKNLQALVPAKGEATLGSPIELFRLAANCYYDLYNNGMCNAPQRLTPLIEALENYRSKGILATQDDEEKALAEDIAILERFHDETMEAEAADPDGDDDDVFFPSHHHLYHPMERLLDAVIRYASSANNPEAPDPRLSPWV